MKTLATLPPLETPGLVVREIEPRDAFAFGRFMFSRDYQKHISFRFKEISELKGFIARNLARQEDARRNIFHLAAESLDTGDAVGDGFIILHAPGTGEIGWGVAPVLWGQGYGTEIGRALLGLAFERLRLETVWCKVMAANTASLRLAARIGMSSKGISPDYPLGGGRFGPVERFSLTREGYFALPY